MQDEHKRTAFYVILAVIIIGILILISLVPYALYLQFCYHSIPITIDKWGQFGDYMGGVLNPIIALINFAFLIFITLLIKKRDDKAHKNALEAQRNVVFTELRHDAYLELQKYVYSFSDFPNTFQDMANQYHILAVGLDHFDEKYGYIFEDVKYDNLITKLKSWATIVSFRCTQMSADPELMNLNPIDVLRDIDNHTQYISDCSGFSDARKKLFSGMRQLILRKPYEHA